MIHRLQVLLIAPLMFGTFTGCSLWETWNRSLGTRQSSAATVPGIRPGHSTDHYGGEVPYAPEPHLQRIAPPPVPPSRSDIPPSRPDQPVIEQEVRLPQEGSQSRFIKTLQTPRIFSPDGVRSIYDRIRGAAQEETPPKPSGPIAQQRIVDPATQACTYRLPESEETNPVRLGLPETEDVESHSSSTEQRELPPVMQAGPSSYKHPLLADPTGVPYGRP